MEPAHQDTHMSRLQMGRDDSVPIRGRPGAFNNAARRTHRLVGRDGPA